MMSAPPITCHTPPAAPASRGRSSRPRRLRFAMPSVATIFADGGYAGRLFAYAHPRVSASQAGSSTTSEATPSETRRGRGLLDTTVCDTHGLRSPHPSATSDPSSPSVIVLTCRSPTKARHCPHTARPVPQHRLAVLGLTCRERPMPGPSCGPRAAGCCRACCPSGSAPIGGTVGRVRVGRSDLQSCAVWDSRGCPRVSQRSRLPRSARPRRLLGQFAGTVGQSVK